jgi:hypothetical protein
MTHRNSLLDGGNRSAAYMSMATTARQQSSQPCGIEVPRPTTGASRCVRSAARWRHPTFKRGWPDASPDQSKDSPAGSLRRYRLYVRHLLIDANIYLEFYRFSKDDLEELRKLAELIREDEIILYVNEQLRDEIRRNRENVLAQALKTVTDAKIPATFPQVLRNYQRFPKLDAARLAYAAEVDKLVSRAREDAAQRKLPADELLDELMGLATDVAITPEIVGAARDRHDRGNPPGKNGSYGDAITWEALLQHHPEYASLDIITSDNDYLSPLRRKELHEFLEHEWDALKRRFGSERGVSV